jgi:subtilase family serine protease
MRLGRIVISLGSAVALTGLAALPMTAAGAAVAGPHVAAHASQGHRMTPTMATPLAYKYAGQAKGPGDVTFSCQQPGAAVGCYTPQEIAAAYDVPSSLTGAGQTIAIIDAFGDPTVTQDLQVFDTTFGLPDANLNVIYPDGQPVFDTSNADMVNWSGEIALDVESAHAIAPAATIDLVVAKSDQDSDIESAEEYVIKHNLGSVLSQSYGEAESCEEPAIEKAEHRAYERAALEKMSVFASSGDDGAAQPSCDGSSFIQSVSTPASDPLVTGVGGTHLDATQTSGAYVSESAWNDEFGSSGGGLSTLYKRPIFQLGQATHGARGVPDVSFSGDVNGGLLIAWSQGDPANLGDIFIFGGTSAGSPQWAAITALADQAAHHRLGFLNTKLYAIAATPLRSFAFHDVTTGNNTVTVSDANGNPLTISGYNAGKGWDPVTGLGSPDVAHLIKILG